MSTICAISTAPGVGGIAVIRVSGTDAFALCDKIFHAHREGHTIQSQKAYTLQYGTIENERGETVDNVVIAVFRAPHSFTGEDTVEISCHGSIYIQQQILQLLIQNGCELAKPGEFTQRAFLNGKMDLSQAEAVADLIASTSEAAHHLALNQMRGELSRELGKLRNQLLHLTSLMELELDFSDHEDLEFANRSELQILAAQVESLINHLVESFSTGNAIKNGIPVAIIGDTNTGKSTLLNALVGDERSIVSNIHGTTRDIIEDTINIQGITFRFIDTAGIRQTDDAIETLGIERSFKALKQAKIVILMYDLQRPSDDFYVFYQKIQSHLANKQIILVMNKCDLVSNIPVHLPEKIAQTLIPQSNIVTVSAKQKISIDRLLSLLVTIVNLPEITHRNIIVTNIRHYEALTHALKSIHRVQKGISINLPNDLISQDLRECIFHLSDIVGEVTTDAVLENIFKHFCIGK